MHDVRVMEDAITAVRSRRRRVDRTIVVRRWPTLDDLLPVSELATAEPARMTAIGRRRTPMPTLIIRRPRSRPVLRWWIAACALVLGGLIVTATIRDRARRQTTTTLETAAGPLFPAVLETGAQPGFLTARPDDSARSTTILEDSDELPPPSMALAEVAPTKLAKRAKSTRAKQRKRWNPDALFLPK